MNIDSMSVCSDEQKFQRLEELIKTGISERAFPCAVCAVGDAQGVKFKKAYGYSRLFEDDSPCLEPFPAQITSNEKYAATDKLIFDMASCTKILSTTILALKLLECGYISLYDSIWRFLPDAPSDKRDIEIFNLMTHTSGIKAHFLLEENCKTPDDALKTILDFPLHNPIGSTVEYTCMGYILLGKIIEKICGSDLATLAREVIYKPLGMTDTCYNPLSCGKKPIEFAVTEYNKPLGKYKCGIVHDENALFLSGVSGNAGIFSTVDDLIKYATMLANFGDTPNGRFLSEATVRKAATNYTPELEDDRGLGFVVKGKKLCSAGDLFPMGTFGHTGYTGTSVFINPFSGRYFILLTNRVHFTRENNLLPRMRRLMHNVIA